MWLSSSPCNLITKYCYHKNISVSSQDIVGGGGGYFRLRRQARQSGNATEVGKSGLHRKTAQCNSFVILQWRGTEFCCGHTSDSFIHVRLFHEIVHFKLQFIKSIHHNTPIACIWHCNNIRMASNKCEQKSRIRAAYCAIDQSQSRPVDLTEDRLLVLVLT